MVFLCSKDIDAAVETIDDNCTDLYKWGHVRNAGSEIFASWPEVTIGEMPSSIKVPRLEARITRIQ